jgi:hypothetical protein
MTAAAITITAITVGTDTFTATAHGLATGDRFRLRNVGGALPAATPSLAAVTDYFAITVDANNLKVAVSSANAFAGTAVDLTGVLTGTTTIEYGLPYAVRRVAIAGSQILSVDDNEAWNALVSLYCLLTGQAQTVWNGITLPANQHLSISGTGEYKHTSTRTLSFTGTAFSVQAGTATIDLTGTINSTALCVLIAGIPLHVGDRITSISVTFDSATGTVDVTDFHVSRITANGAATSLGSTTVSNIGAPTTTTIDLTDTTLAANESFIISISINATGCSVRNVNVSYTHP